MSCQILTAGLTQNARPQGELSADSRPSGSLVAAGRPQGDGMCRSFNFAPSVAVLIVTLVDAVQIQSFAGDDLATL